MRIIVDAFGGDNAPIEILKGCRMALDELPELEITLTGKETEIRRVSETEQISLDRMTIIDAPTVISMEDAPTDVMRSKKDCSMAEGLRRLAADEGDAFISAGSTGALVVGATMIVKRIKGIKRAALAPVIPNDNGFFMLLDSGANVDCKPEFLRQFGIMGSVYMEKVMGIPNPRVGLVNVGTEDSKGGELQHQAFELLKQAPIHFIGNIEARTVPSNGADVVVTDGFTGNVMLKLYEGVSSTLFRKVKGVMMKRFTNKLAALVLKKDFAALKKTVDYNEYGGAPLIGVTKPVFKAHGSSKAKTFYNALKITYRFVEGNVIRQIADSIAKTTAAEGSEE